MSRKFVVALSFVAGIASTQAHAPSANMGETNGRPDMKF